MKEIIYEIENKYLSKHASFSEKAGGRMYPLDPCPIRTEYQRDRDRIIHCKSFRRLKHKTQVFLSPEGDHYRTRLTHTLEVAQIARTISRCLRLNEDLTEAIALGHDLGHTPFGHAGERTLDRLTGHFEHNEQSLRVVEVLEGDGKGLNLTELVRDGILNHKSKCNPRSLEGKVVSLSDRIAYLNHDIDDAERAGLIMEKDLPTDVVAVLGRSKSERINRMVSDIISVSMGENFVRYSKEFEEAESALRKYLFTNLYTGGLAKVEEVKANTMIELIYDAHQKDPALLPDSLKKMLDSEPRERVITDYIAGMTDGYAIARFNELYVPKIWK